MRKLSRRPWLVAGSAVAAASAVGAYAVLRPKPAPIGFAVSPDEMARAAGKGGALLAVKGATFCKANPSG